MAPNITERLQSDQRRQKRLEKEPQKKVVRTSKTGMSVPSSQTLTVWIMRGFYLTIAIIIGLYYQQAQDKLNDFYNYAISTWFFNSVYFETWFTIVVYGVLLPFPYLMSKLPVFDRYKIDPNIHWQGAGIKRQLCEIVEYAVPLNLMDTFMVKKYTNCGINPDEWDLRRADWIQHTRALPEQPPTIIQIGYQLLFAFILYDIIFFCVHYMAHKNAWLYKNVHSLHHNHDVVFSRVTNQLTICERILLVLSANFSLRLVHSHPLTRAIFIPLFVGWLIENHLGYDLPITLDKVIPGGLVGGASRHYAHHVHGNRFYQPFFTYIDAYLNRKNMCN